MRLVMTLLVRDEEELLAANLDYHLARGVDFVLVTDHRSRDATPDILGEYAARGLAQVFREDGDALEQSAWVTRMARLAATEHEADWVLNNDADEFWWPLVGELKDTLALVPERYGQLSVPRHNFIPLPGEEPFWRRMVVREVRSKNLIGSELEPNTIHRARSDVQIDPGNHAARGSDLPLGPRLPLLEALHFPIRSYEQFARKVEHQGIGYSTLRDRAPEVGRDQLMLYDVQRRGELADWLAKAQLDESQVEAALARGELVVDRRLARFMAELAEDGPERAGSPAHELAVRGLADSAFAQAARAEAAEAERDRAARQLEEATDSLESVRNSRLFRWTRGARRLYYRARRR
jgi:hypothetical protein